MRRIVKLLIQLLTGIITRKFLGAHTYGLIVKTDKFLFAVDPQDSEVGMKLRRKGIYGAGEIKRINSFITEESKILIVGAHIGTLAIPLSKKCKEVVAIEANPSTFELLKMNLALNSISNCQAINIAASDKEEKIRFLQSRINSGGSKRVPQNKEFAYYYDNPKEITAQAYNLDSFLCNQKFDIVLMDIEGSEYFALKGMQKILSFCKVLIVEFFPHHLKNVSGVTLEEFLSVIQPHFSKLTIPSKGLELHSPEMSNALNKMYGQGMGDDGIIFEKSE